MSFATNPVDGVRIYFEAEGSGTPVVFYPGADFSHHFARDFGFDHSLIPGYQMIYLDPRGTGQSDVPLDPHAHVLDRLVEDVIAVLDAAGVDRAHYYGFSRGGWVGFGLAAHAPERLRSLVVGGMSPYHRTLGPPLAPEALAAYVAEHYEPLPEKTLNDFLNHSYESVDASRQGLGLSRALDERVSSITTPALLYCGRNDEFHEPAQRAANEMPAATFLSLPALDHIESGMRNDLIGPYVRLFLDQIDCAAI